jgi:hypothetical protein
MEMVGTPPGACARRLCPPYELDSGFARDASASGMTGAAFALAPMML